MAVNESKQRMEFGGFNWVSAFYGWLVAMAASAMVTALLAAAGVTVAYTDGVATFTNTSAGVGVFNAILLLIGLGVSYYAGGYVAGRMSRFDGGRQGTGVWAMGILAAVLLAAAGALFGANYNLLQVLNLPHIPVDQGSLTAGGIITLVLGLALTLVAAISGAKVGEAYHRRIDLAGVSESDEPMYEPVETARPATPVEAQEEEAPAQRQTGFTRPNAQPTFGERIERTERERDARKRGDRK